MKDVTYRLKNGVIVEIMSMFSCTCDHVFSGEQTGGW